jgi:hypothetical protein
MTKLGEYLIKLKFHSEVDIFKMNERKFLLTSLSLDNPSITQHLSKFTIIIHKILS